MGQRIVVKVGSLGVGSPQGGVDLQKVSNLIADIANLKALGHQIVLVSSGAINAGRPFLEKPVTKELSLSYQQALAAIGMPLLMNAYKASLKHDFPLAQVLVTHEDFKARERFLNVRNTLLTLLDNNILPIVNENDTVSTREISVGDNDQLAAMIAEAIDADRLILLTEADGLYDRDPKDPKAQHLPVIDFRDDFKDLKLSTKTSVGRGGMATKLMAVRRLTPLGQDVTIATFNAPAPTGRALDGAGTLFKGNPREKVKKRLSWIASIARTGCAIVVDDGAAKALGGGKASLLPVGIRKVVGVFKRGDVVAVKYKQKTLALGIVEYDSAGLDKLKGKKSSDLDALFEVTPSYVAIHRDNIFFVKD